MCCIKVERGWAPLVLSGINVECPHKYLTKKWARCEWVVWVHVHICESFLVLLKKCWVFTKGWGTAVHENIWALSPLCPHLSVRPLQHLSVSTSPTTQSHHTLPECHPHKIQLMLLKYWRLKVYLWKPASQTIFYSWNKSFSRMPFISVYVTSSFTLQI